MANPPPIVNYAAFTLGLHHARNTLLPYFTNFQATFGNAPDERGLSDMFLYDLAVTSGVVVQYVSRLLGGRSSSINSSY